MADFDLSVETIGKLSPSQLVELLERLDPTDDALQQIDVDVIARAIDPTRLGDGEFASLLSSVDRLAGAGAGVDLSTMGAQTFARLIGRASRTQLQEVLARPELRVVILDEVFRRMQLHLRVERARSVDAVVHWRFTGGAGEDGYDRYTSVISHGTCSTSRDGAAEPRVTITVSPYDFLRLITSNASAPVLFMTGKLKVRGDLAFAASMMGLFDLPRPSD
jgi:SCP-2 sterol transfer family protein